MHIKGPETRQCPPEFQARLTRMFGKNQFGEPHYKIVWGQSQFIRMGNLWRDKHGNERLGYRDRPQCHQQPCWVIMRWHSPLEYGSPATYYRNTFIPNGVSKGFYVTGEYPYRGRYEIVQPLISKEFVAGKLVVTHFPLSHFLIDRLIPMMVQFANLSQRQKQAIQAANKAIEDKKETEFVADVLENNMPRWMGPVSYTRQGIKTSLLTRKMDQIQKVWDRMSRGGRRPKFNRGMAQGDRPVVRH
jgi:hypothetical protein